MMQRYQGSISEDWQMAEQEIALLASTATRLRVGGATMGTLRLIFLGPVRL